MFSLGYAVSLLAMLKATSWFSSMTMAVFLGSSYLVSLLAFPLLLFSDTLVVICILAFAFPVYYLLLKKCNKEKAFIKRGLFLKAEKASSLEERIPLVFIVSFILVAILLSIELQYKSLVNSGDKNYAALFLSICLSVFILAMYCRKQRIDYNKMLFLIAIPVAGLSILIAGIDPSHRSVIGPFFGKHCKNAFFSCLYFFN